MPNTTPDYAALTQFLLQPFLAEPEALRVDVETSHGNTRALVRVAMSAADQGNVLGQRSGSRHVQAMRTVLEGLSAMSEQAARLEVFGMPAAGSDRGARSAPRDDRPRSSAPRPTRKPRSDV
jgi:uncharacterized protein